MIGNNPWGPVRRRCATWAWLECLSPPQQPILRNFHAGGPVFLCSPSIPERIDAVAVAPIRSSPGEGVSNVLQDGLL